MISASTPLCAAAPTTARRGAARPDEVAEAPSPPSARRLRAPPAGAAELGSAAQRVFELDLEHRPNCGGELKIIAAIQEQPVIEKVLTHLGLQARAPPRSPARGQALQAARHTKAMEVQEAQRQG